MHTRQSFRLIAVLLTMSLVLGCVSTAAGATIGGKGITGGPFIIKSLKRSSTKVTLTVWHGVLHESPGTKWVREFVVSTKKTK